MFIQETLSETVSLVNKGYTLKYVSDKLNIAQSTLMKWILIFREKEIEKIKEQSKLNAINKRSRIDEL